MVSDKIIITNPSGLYLRPAGMLCNEAMKFKSLITFGTKGSTANAKSLLSVLGAGVRCGDIIELCCDGEDEDVAIDAIRRAIQQGLGETA